MKTPPTQDTGHRTQVTQTGANVKVTFLQYSSHGTRKHNGRCQWMLMPYSTVIPMDQSSDASMAMCQESCTHGLMVTNSCLDGCKDHSAGGKLGLILEI